MLRGFENRQWISQVLFLALLFLILCTFLIYRFTIRVPLEEERTRAHIILRNLYAIERAYFEAHETYLPINPKIGDILKLNDPPGRFRYRVEADHSSFVAIAEANLGGIVEIWQVDAENPDPFLKKKD